MNDPAQTLIRTIEKPACYLCGTQGKPLYNNLSDRLFGVPGLWNLKKCPEQECGLIWLDPMPMPEDISKAYVNYFTHGVTYGTLSWQNIRILFKKIYQYLQGAYLAYGFGYLSNSFCQRTIGVLLSALPWSRQRFGRDVAWLTYKHGGRLLDVGCGNGSFLANMKRLGWLVEGVEVDPKAVIQARSKGVEVWCQTLQEKRYPDNFFDAITLFHVIEHVHEPLEMLAECWRILKKGGLLILTTPNTQSLGRKIFREYWRGFEPPRHLYLFCRASLARAVELSGFSNFLITTKASAFYFWTSKKIAQNRVTNRSFLYNFYIRLFAYLFELREKMLLTNNPEVGETLFFKGIK